MKLLNGAELVDNMKERQAKQVRALRQTWYVNPRLAIVSTTDDPVAAKYLAIKQSYGQDILVDVDVHQTTMAEVTEVIDRLNADTSVHGIIIQLPLADPTMTDTVVDQVDPAKDVDGLGKHAVLDAPTAVAINWLLAGYNVELKNRTIVIVGNGRLVGSPLAQMWRDSGLDVMVVDDTHSDLESTLLGADIIVTAAGVPGLVSSDMVRPDSVVVDAGTSSENGRIVGDVADDVRERHDLTITPQIGGVGPLTVCALFDNVIRAARATASSDPA